MEQQQIEEKAKDLTRLHGTTVHPIVLKGDNGQTHIGFIKEPKRQAKMAAFDRMAMSGSLTEAGEIILNSSLIREESDPNMGHESTNDKVYIGACLECVHYVQVYVDDYKKKAITN